jgi:signal transduction histidine kinase/ligand-binding sensor domain-containing protein
MHWWRAFSKETFDQVPGRSWPWVRTRLFQWLIFCALLFLLGGVLKTTAKEPISSSKIPDVVREVSPNESVQDTPTGPQYGKAGRQIRFEQLSLEHGLSQSVVLGILQDSKGFLWFATQDGLNRYDGYEFVVYKHDSEDPTSISDSFAQAIFEDQDGVLWIGTNVGGLNRFDRETGTFTHYRHDPNDPNSLSNNDVQTIYQDREGTFWIGTQGGGLNRFDPQTETFAHYPFDAKDPAGLGSNNVLTLYQDREGRLWVGTAGGGLSQLDRETGTFVRYQNVPNDSHSLSNDVVQSILQDREGTLWVGTADGLNRFDPTDATFTSYHHDPNDAGSLSSNDVEVIHQDSTGELWLGTDGGGLNRFVPETESFTHLQHDPRDPYSLSIDSVESILEDREGILWFGTFGGGINKFNRRTEVFEHYRNNPDDANSLSQNIVWSIYKDPEGTLWIGTDSGGLNRFDRSTGTFARYQNDPNDPESLGGDTVWSIYRDPEGVFWVGSNAGLSRFTPESGAEAGKEKFVHDTMPPVLSIYQDHTDRIWLGTLGGGLFVSDGEDMLGQYQHDPRDPSSLSSNQVVTIFEDREGTIWVGTFNGGLNRFDRATETFTHYQNDPGDPRSLSHNTVLTICQDQGGTLWIGTLGGLDRFEAAPETFIHYREKDGLPNEVIYSILEDEETGHLWFSTNRGLSRFDPLTEDFENYDVDDGLQSNEFNMGSYTKGSDGEMFFGGINGFNAFYPSEIEDNPLIPPLVLTSLTQGGEAIDLEKAIDSVNEITLRWPNTFFEFEVAALSYVRPEKNQYAYILEGFRNETWNEINTRRYGRYTNLPGGTYTLRIRGSNNDGLWNEEGISLRITIVPPFWATWWFRGIAILALIVAGVTGYRLRVRSVEERSQELAALVKERTHEVEQRRRELEVLYRADEELYRYLHLDQVLQALVVTAIRILKAHKGSLLVWDKQRERLVMRASYGFNPETVQKMFTAAGEGVAGRVALTGQPFFVEDTHADPRVTWNVVEIEGIRAFVQVPIRVAGEVFGVFSADYLHPRTFTEDDHRLLLSLAERAAKAIENAQLYEQAQEMGIAEERQRLARELHDSVTQALYGVTLYAEATTRLLSSGEVAMATDHLQELRSTAQEALREMRLLIFELRPPALEKDGLAKALQTRLEAVEERAGLATSLNIDTCERLPLGMEEGLYRIAQEALNNALKHAQAHRVTVTLHQNRHSVIMEIVDDGVGFDPMTTQEYGLGLPGMEERVTKMGGKLDIDSRPGQGTHVRVEVPL